LKSKELARERVKFRVQAGGHDINEETINRRYVRGIENLNNIFRNAVNAWAIYDNSGFRPRRIATGVGDRIDVSIPDIWKKIQGK
jgi:predicted ABC-type ATPase